jgi:UDP:flavonoid glycosyltransferase YjiC (YdhE family)
MYQQGPGCVLVAPLDWGLGHATRCIPIIKQLCDQGCRVLVAANGPQQVLLKQEFPHLVFLEIPGYQVKYSPFFSLKWGLLLNLPSILRTIKKEHLWLKKCLKSYPINAVISDNRYGLFSNEIACVFITHQLYIQSGLKGINILKSADMVSAQKPTSYWVDRLILKWNYRFISKFSECWVPDEDSVFSLAGKLSHPPIPVPVPLKYIGILSRFERFEKPIKRNLLLIILSGPEPQRSALEKILINQLSDIDLKVVLVRGLPGGGETDSQRNGLDIFNHLPSETLSEFIATSEYIIARSGYSTIMDLIKMRRTAILIPTPGQTEQEYLAHYLNNKKWMYRAPQKKFNLNETLTGFKKSKLKLPDITDSRLHIILKEFMQTIPEEDPPDE